jgi:hypothetical protein
MLFRQVMWCNSTIVVSQKKHECPYEHPQFGPDNSSATPSHPSTPRQPSSIILLGAVTCHYNRQYYPAGWAVPIVSSLHRRRRSSSSMRRALIAILLVINTFFSSFNDVDPSHMMLVDCCVLCCRGCGPIAAVWRRRTPWSIEFDHILPS